MFRDLLRALPNVISLSRLGLAGLFLASSDPFHRALLVAAAAATDAIDGWIARAANVATRLGALIDPIADRTFAFLAVAALVLDGTITPWQCALLLARDVMTIVGYITARIMPTLRAVPFQARPLGKVVTVLQLFTLFVALAHPSWTAPFAYLTGAAAVASIVDYTWMLVKARRAVLAAARAKVVAVLLVALLAPLAAATLEAQGVPAERPRPEWRLAVAEGPGAELGAGLAIGAGLYTRLVPLAGVGAVRRPDGSVAPTARAEITGRFTLDPFAQWRWAPYGAAGLQLGCREAAVCRAGLLARVGIEGPLWRNGWRPALEAGLGDGAHVAVALRRSRWGRR